MRKHLAIMDKSTIEAILSGRKSMESRFSKAKIPPFGIVSVGDLVYLKLPGKEILGQFRVKKVFFYDGLDFSDLNYLRNLYGKKLRMDKNFWERKKDCRYGTIIFIGESERFITSPVRVKKSDLRGWMVLGK